MRRYVVRTLLVAPTQSIRESAATQFTAVFGDRAEITLFHSFPEAVEHLERSRESYHLIAFESPSGSETLSRTMVELGGTAAFLLWGGGEKVAASLQESGVPLVRLSETAFEDSMRKAIRGFELSGRIPFPKDADTGSHLAVRGSVLRQLGTLKGDVFLRITDGRYVLAFKKGTTVTGEEVERYGQKAGGPVFFIRAEDEKLFVSAELGTFRQVIQNQPIDPAEVERHFSRNYELVRDVVGQIGFSAEAQEVALTSVAATLKLIEASPQLSRILADLERNSSSSVSARSFQLGKVACALAHKVGWRSNSTYFKLSLSAFLHDLPLDDDRLARVRDYESAQASGEFTEGELHQIRFHPVKAAEYARQFNQIPQDVEQILIQHHEKPNGTGFPRGLVVRYFSPLGALFVMAHDLVDYASRHDAISLEDFYSKREMEYSVGVFRKLFRALRDGVLLT